MICCDRYLFYLFIFIFIQIERGTFDIFVVFYFPSLKKSFFSSIFFKNVVFSCANWQRRACLKHPYFLSSFTVHSCFYLLNDRERDDLAKLLNIFNMTKTLANLDRLIIDCLKKAYKLFQTAPIIFCCRKNLFFSFFYFWILIKEIF